MGSSAAAGAGLTPRVYQLELLELAVQQNVVAFLDTGSGKTLVSVLLLKHHLAQRRAEAATAAGRGARAPPHRVAAFLAPKVALVLQQADVLRAHLPARVAHYVGEMGVDAWGRQKWREEIGGNDVLVLTPQILVNILDQGILGVGELHLLVFDEAHHASGKHPYALIMGAVRAAGPGVPRPRVFGMTAAPVNLRQDESSGKMEARIRALEAMLDSRVVTVVNRREVERVAPPPELLVAEYRPAAPEGGAAELAARIERARTRLRLAIECSEEGWQLSMQRTLGVEGVAPEARRLYFDPGTMFSSASRLHQMLGGVLHVLEEQGVFCAAACASEVIGSQARGAPTRLSCYTAAGAGGAGPRAGPGPAAAAVGAADAEARREALLLALDHAGLGFEEVESEQRAVDLSIADAVLAFGALLAPPAWRQQPGSSPRPAAAGGVRFLLNALRTAAEGDKPLGALARQAMEAVAASVLPEELQASLDAVLAGGSRAQQDGGEPSGGGGGGSGGAGSVPLVTHKAAVLVAELLRRRGAAAAAGRWSGIVFATQRVAVVGLHALLRALPCTRGWLRSSALMGLGAALGDVGFGFQEQGKILSKFRAGELNLLVSTAVAEEGIDVKSCQLVVRYDLPATAQSFLQSRGRARMRGSDMVMLVAAGRPEETELIAHMLEYESSLRQEALLNIHRLQQGGCGSDEEDAGPAGPAEEDTSSVPVFVVEASGARATADNALNLVERFVAKLPHDRYMLLRPMYRTEDLGDGRYRARLYLPSSSPLQAVDGGVQPGRKPARVAAAVEAVRRLHGLGALNDRLKPAALAGEEGAEATGAGGKQSGRSHLPMVKLLPPSLLMSGSLKALLEQPIAVLHCYVWQPVEGADPRAAKLLRSRLARLGLLLPLPLDLDPLPSLRLNAAPGGGGAAVTLQPLAPGYPITLTAAHLALLQRCSRVLLQHSLGGGYKFRGEGSAGVDGGLVLAPLKPPAEGEPWLAPELDWHTIEAVAAAAGATDAAGAPASALARLQQGQGPGALQPGEAVLVTQYIQISYLFRGIAEQTLDSPITFQWKRDHAATSEQEEEEEGEVEMAASCRPASPAKTFADYYRLRWGKAGLCPDQPLLRADRLTPSRLMQGLGPTAAPETPGDGEQPVLVPQLCWVHPVPASLWPSLAHVPSLVWQLEGGMVARGLLTQLLSSSSSSSPSQGAPSVELVRTALTARSALDTGDLEALEILGDSFLKFAVSISLYQKHKHYHEGQLAALKDRVVSNAALLQVALRLGLHCALLVVPPGAAGSEAGGSTPGDEEGGGGLSRNGKVLADAVEALVGAFLVGAGEPAALSLLQHLQLISAPCWLHAGPLPVPQSDPGTEVDVATVGKLLGHRFRRGELAVQALTHGSWLGAPCYQRLEFLGDAVLDAALTRHLYSPSCLPGEVHDARSAAVNAERLAMAAVRLGLHAHLRHQSPKLFGHVTDFLEAYRSQAEAMQKAGGLSPEQAWHAVPAAHSFGLPKHSAPKVLSDIVESLIGAVFIDTRCSLDATWAVAHRLLAPLAPLGKTPVHPKRELHERVQQWGVAPEFKRAATSAEGVRAAIVVGGQVIATGDWAPNLKLAIRLASQAALLDWAQVGPKGRAAARAAAAKPAAAGVHG